MKKQRKQTNKRRKLTKSKQKEIASRYITTPLLVLGPNGMMNIGIRERKEQSHEES